MITSPKIDMTFNPHAHDTMPKWQEQILESKPLRKIDYNLDKLTIKKEAHYCKTCNAKLGDNEVGYCSKCR